MLNYACEAGEACKAGNSYAATLWQHLQVICRQQLCQLQSLTAASVAEGFHDRRYV